MPIMRGDNMRCEICGKKLRKWAYKWLGRIYCRKCFEKAREKKMWDFSVDWDYELIDVKKHEAQGQLSLIGFMGGKSDGGDTENA